ncbi:hypothetical protein SESBI_24339 [Sesbania bispinosa]|nr:hypothetical protein SESBI_24339 [Sesbania bispinosa]
MRKKLHIHEAIKKQTNMKGRLRTNKTSSSSESERTMIEIVIALVEFQDSNTYEAAETMKL